MKLLQQNYASSCGLAVAAMLSDLGPEGLARIEAEFPRWRSRGMTALPMRDLLESVSGRLWRVVMPGAVTLTDYWREGRLPREGAAVWVRPGPRHHGHWVAVEGRTVFDPEFRRPRSLRTYPLRSWLCHRVVEPVESRSGNT